MTKDLILTGLPRTPGWTSLSPEKQRWLQQETSDALEHRQMSGVHALAEAAKLYGIEQRLKNEKRVDRRRIKAHRNLNSVLTIDNKGPQFLTLFYCHKLLTSCP